MFALPTSFIALKNGESVSDLSTLSLGQTSITDGEVYKITP